MALKAGVSLVCMNRPETLRVTLERLEQTLTDDVPVIIVDNGSSDGQTLNLLDLYKTRKGWECIKNVTNQGLSVAVNQGLAHLRGQGCEVLIHLDDDAVVQAPGGWPLHIGGLMERNPELGLLTPNGRSQYVEFIPRPSYDEIRWGLGYVWALRGATYDVIGGYDRHLLHQQECDIALRVRMADKTVGSLNEWKVQHNDPGLPPSELSQARAHLGIVQFRDKWTSYFRGKGWSYGTMPLYLMQHWPPDEEWYRLYGLANNINLNPPPEGAEANTSEWALGGPHYPVGSVNGLTAEQLTKMQRLIRIGQLGYMIQLKLVNDHAYWERGDAYLRDREQAIARWKELSGQDYTGYPWGDVLGTGCRL